MTIDQWRVVMFGDGNAGKTAIAVQFALDFFTGIYDPTIEDMYRKQMLVDDRMCHIELVDTTGQEEYSTLRDQWIREGQGFVIAYSITSRRSFERLETFRQALLRAKAPSPPLFILVGNKCDRTDEREVSRQEGEGLAARWGCEFMEISAKTNVNVDKVFIHLVRALRLVRDGAMLPPTGGAPGPLPTQSKRRFRQARQTRLHKGMCIVA